jgi:hypothetical protein
MDSPKQRLKFYNPWKRKSGEYDVEEIVERAKGPNIAHAKDDEGHTLNRFVSKSQK